GRASSEDIGRVVAAEAGFEAGMELVRRLAFAVLTGNADAHAKNWSLRYDDPRQPSLAPAYDLVGTVAFLPDTALALSLGGARTMPEVDLGRFARFAARVGLPRAAVEEQVVATIRRLRTAWREHPAVGTLPADQRKALELHALAVPLWREG
ncbi:MAG TPA: HipA domain-containing protein, partial [Gemmatimonadales bacterium]|nr:HipA domain-containing protein [Gemmatimonadales bacterium]